ncbi:unnamed protein product [Durusdinium trenchii]|uniref:Protein SirB1 N-terminal domain-containing protein n=1 Tax=Durusdinium trenchii TaxID=1381693 RepID=A0ABP0NHV1_9DINO
MAMDLWRFSRVVRAPRLCQTSLRLEYGQPLRSGATACAAVSLGVTRGLAVSLRGVASGARIARRSRQDTGSELRDPEGDPVSESLRRALAEFQAEVSKPQEEIDLTRAAALLALHAEPDLDLEQKVFTPLRHLGEGFRLRAAELRRLGGDGDEALSTALCAYLTAEGFTGCSRSPEDFYQSKYSLLHKVLEKRRGIPISLAVVYREVAAAAGLDLWGANFPGYFFLAYGHGSSAGLVDAFAGQSAHTVQGCQELVSEAFGRPARLAPGWAELRMPHGAFLRRMVRNLEHVYKREANLSAAATITQYAQVLDRTLENQRL